MVLRLRVQTVLAKNNSVPSVYHMHTRAHTHTI